MFERFTHAARLAVVYAQAEARDMRSEEISCAHMLIGLAVERSSRSATVLADAGLSLDRLRQRALRGLQATAIDDEALADLGIDMEEVRSRVEEHFGAGALDVPPKRWRGGHIPFDKGAKKSFECALREAVHRKDSSIEDLHVLLGVIRADPENLEALFGVDVDSLRTAVHRALHGQAA